MSGSVTLLSRPRSAFVVLPPNGGNATQNASHLAEEERLVALELGRVRQLLHELLGVEIVVVGGGGDARRQAETGEGRKAPLLDTR